ncbi:MAG: 2OG-Fe(II) oxygenase [Sphingomonas sp.]
MQWPPYFSFDLAGHGLLPADWAAQVRAASLAPEREAVVDLLAPAPQPETFLILEGRAVRNRLGWLADLYRGTLCDFVSRSFGRPCYPANRISLSMTLNILQGQGTETGWHHDTNPVTGLLFATTMVEGQGGELEFRHPDHGIAQLRPSAGVFICFPGEIEHRVLPLSVDMQRLSFPLIYYDSATDQPFANEDDRYEMSAP